MDSADENLGKFYSEMWQTAFNRLSFGWTANTASWLLVVAIALYGYAYRIQRANAAPLKAIPTLGPSGVISSYVGALKFFFRAKAIVQAGYDKFHGRAFKIAQINKWLVVVSGAQMVEDIRKAPDDVLSLRHAIDEQVQVEYTFGPDARETTYHVDVLRGALTRNIDVRFADVRDEIATAFADEIPPTKNWTSVVAMDAIRRIVSRTSNRLFVGLPLCRDPDYRDLNIELTTEVIKATQIINFFPNSWKPTVARLFTDVSGSLKKGEDLLRVLLQERLDNEEYFGEMYPERPNDLITWLLDRAPPEKKTVADLTLRILIINFSAIHTTSMAFVSALYNLAVNPQLAQELREEVEGVMRTGVWSKATMSRMRKMDSFLKESERFDGAGAIGMVRKVMKDFTFSDGTFIPAGNFVSVASYSTHLDESNYSSADKFDGLRFARLGEKSEKDQSAHDMLTLNPEYLVFGHGRHACPGRFFAVNELKAMLSHVVMTYDVKFENDTSTTPPPWWFAAHIFPDPTKKVMFRARQTH